MEFIYKGFKICLFLFNAFYFLIGIGIITTAVFLYFNTSQINDLIKADHGEQYLKIIYFLLIFGTFLIFVGFLGCSGVLSEKSWLLFVYFSILFLIFALQFTGAIYIYMMSFDYYKQFQDKIMDAIQNQYGTSQVHTRAIDYLHYNYKCCGWKSPNDWLNSTYLDPKYTFKSEEKLPSNLFTVSPYNSLYVYKIPSSCCAINYDLTCVIMHKFYEVGCETIVKIYYKQLEVYVAWSLAFMNLFQLVLLLLSLYTICILFFDKNNYMNTEFTQQQFHNDHDDDVDQLEDPNLINRNHRLHMTSCYL
jgi:hypothetical protein